MGQRLPGRQQPIFEQTPVDGFSRGFLAAVLLALAAGAYLYQTRRPVVRPIEPKGPTAAAGSRQDTGRPRFPVGSEEAARLRDLGRSSWRAGRPKDAAAAYEKALALYRQEEDVEGAAFCHYGLAMARSGDDPDADAGYEESARLYRELLQGGSLQGKDRLGIERDYANVLSGLGGRLLRVGRFAEAESAAAERLGLYQRLGDVGGQAVAYAELGQTILPQGRPAEAAEAFSRSASLYETARNPWGVKSSREKALQARIAAGGQADPAPLSAGSVSGFVADAMKRLDDPDPGVRALAARDLASKGSHSLPAAARLIVLLKDPDSSVRYEAAGALGGLGPGGRSASSPLAEALGDPSVAVRRGAAMSLGMIRAVEAVPSLERALGDDDVHVRIHAAGSLLRMGQSRQRALEVLEEGARSPDQNVRRAAEHILQLNTGR